MVEPQPLAARDVHDDRGSFEEFRERDELLTLAEAAAGIGIWELDLTTMMLRGTAQFFRIMGLPPMTEPIAIEVTRALRHPSDQARIRRGFDAAIASGSNYFESEYRIIRSDGETRWILGRGRVVRNTAGQPLRLSGVDVDITSRKLAEAALRESEERFRRLFEQSPLGKAMAGADFRFRDVNPALCAMLGYSVDELIGRSFLELVHADDRATCAARGKALVDGEIQQLQLEERFIRKSGEPFWVSVNVGPIRDADGNILYTLGVIENIDERKRVAQAVQESEIRLRVLNAQLGELAVERTRQLTSSRVQLQTFFENSPEWLTLQRPLPDGGFAYVDINRTCEEAYGMSRDQVVGRRVEEILGEEGAQVPLSNMRECVRSRQTQRYTAQRTMAGRTRTIDVMCVFVPDQAPGGEPFVLTTARDITEREQLEAQLRQAQKMEAIGQLTGGVAHDFNNLLAIIGGNAELARRNFPASAGRHIDNIQRAAERGVALTRQLLSFSRRHVAKPQLIDLAQEMPRMAEMLRASLRGNIDMRLDVASKVSAIEADVAELEIALLNIAVNARDAMPQGGTFEIRVRDAEPAHVVIELCDSGSGIHPEIIGKVFDPFFTTKEPGEGTGLGLSQVYGFAHQSGGTVAIDSRPGAGTKVMLVMPRSSRPLPASDNAEPAVATTQMSGRVLLVEDNPQVADVISQMLSAMGLQVETVDRARKALDRLDTASPRVDLLVTDVVMPDGMNGLDLAMRCRSRFPSLPIIVTSGYNDAVVPVGINLPMLRKPVPYDELYRVVRASLAGNRTGLVAPT